VEVPARPNVQRPATEANASWLHEEGNSPAARQEDGNLPPTPGPQAVPPRGALDPVSLRWAGGVCMGSRARGSGGPLLAAASRDVFRCVPVFCQRVRRDPGVCRSRIVGGESGGALPQFGPPAADGGRQRSQSTRWRVVRAPGQSRCAWSAYVSRALPGAGSPAGRAVGRAARRCGRVGGAGAACVTQSEARSQKSDAGSRMPDARCQMPDTKYWMPERSSVAAGGPSGGVAPMGNRLSRRPAVGGTQNAGTTTHPGATRNRGGDRSPLGSAR